jgi:nucleoside-diphosphate-sugar epimerase
MTVKKILLTGANGRIGRTYFKAMCNTYDFILTDLNLPDYEISSPHRFIPADLSKPGSATELLTAEKPDVIVHLAGIPNADAAFEQLLPANILAVTYLLEAVAATSCHRFIFASSAQTIEGYPVDVQIHPGLGVAPANLYGVTKCYGEALCSFYATQRGLSCVALRIGAFEPKDPDALKNARDYSAWLSPQDAVKLITSAIEAEDITFFIGYGISNNRFKRFDLSRTREVLNYQPTDDAFREFQPGPFIS